MKTMLKHKRYLFMLNATAECELPNWNHLAVYSFLVYRAGMQNKSARIERIAKWLRLHWQTVQLALDDLQRLGLVAPLENGRYIAQEPSSSQWSWFLTVTNTDNWAWHKRFASYRYYVTKHIGADTLTPRESAILCKVHSWQESGLKINKKGFATQTLIAYRTVTAIFARLKARGLLDDQLRVAITEAQTRYWEDQHRPKTKPTNSLRDWFAKAWGDIECEYFDSLDHMCHFLELSEESMLRAGYNRKEIRDYFRFVAVELLDKQPECIEVFLLRVFSRLFAAVERVHDTNRHLYPNSLGLLKYQSRGVCNDLMRNYNKDQLIGWEPSFEWSNGKA